MHSLKSSTNKIKELVVDYIALYVDTAAKLLQILIHGFFPHTFNPAAQNT